MIESEGKGPRYPTKLHKIILIFYVHYHSDNILRNNKYKR